MSKKIIIAYINAGKGHISVAHALKNHLEKEKLWQVTLVNPYTDIVPPSASFFKKLTGKTGDELSALLYKDKMRYLQHKFFFLLGWLIRSNHFFFRHKGIELLTQYWYATRPDMVISVVPWANTLFAESLVKLSSTVPLITIVTDLCEHASKKWFSNKNQYLICGTEKLIAQAKDSGHPNDKIFPVSGMVVADAFYKTVDKQAERVRLGLDPLVPTGIVTYGGVGSNAMIEIARVMDSVNYPLQLIFICAGNNNAVEAISKMPTRYKKLVLGLVESTDCYMNIADFFIGKSGAISITEALIKKLPMVLEFNNYTFAQEIYNAEWAAEKEVALLEKNMSDLPNTVSKLLANYEFYQSSIAKLGDLKAIFEIPDILEKIITMHEK